MGSQPEINKPKEDLTNLGYAPNSNVALADNTTPDVSGYKIVVPNATVNEPFGGKAKGGRVSDSLNAEPTTGETKDTGVVFNTNKTATVKPTGPGATGVPSEDGLKGLKDFFWDKDKGGMTTHGLLTLGALARVISGEREKNGGMAGGGLESANVGTALSGLFAGKNKRRDEVEAQNLEREKMANDKEIAGIKADPNAKADTSLTAARRAAYQKQLAPSDWTTEAKLQAMVPGGETLTGPQLRYEYLKVVAPDAAEQYKQDMMSGLVTDSAAAAPVAPQTKAKVTPL